MNALFHIEEPSEPDDQRDERYTPAKYVAAAREVMGGWIDLDPASCEYANRTVKARRYYTKTDNGLALSWQSESIWLNPPFSPINGKSGQATWSHHLIRQFRKGNVKQAILLVTANTEVTWFDVLWDFPICFCSKRLDYISPTPGQYMKSHQSRFGTCFVYLGTNTTKFLDAFCEFGPIETCIRPAKKRYLLSDGPELWDTQF